MELIQAITLCKQRGIKVYPVQVSKSTKFKIQVDENGKLKTFSKELKQGTEPSIAMAKVYIHIAKEIIKEK